MAVSNSPLGGRGSSRKQVASSVTRGNRKPARVRLSSGRYALAAATAAGLIGLLGSERPVHATTVSSWNATLAGGASSGNWNVSGNWTNGIPSVAGDTASFSETITSGSTITLGLNESIGTLNFGPTTSGYTIAGPGILTFDSGTPGVPAYLNTLAGNFTTDTISAPITLDSNLLITQGDLKIDPINISGTITGNGSSPGDPTGADNSISFHGEGVYSGAGGYTLNLTGPVSNVSAIRNLYGNSDTTNNAGGFLLTVSGNISNGATTVELDSYGDSGLKASGVITTSGGLLVNGPGSLQTMSSTLSSSFTGEVDLTGSNAITGGTTVNGAFLFLDYSATGGNNNKIDPNSALTLNSSYLSFNAASAGSTQVVSGLVVGGGANEIKLTGTMTFNTGSGAFTRNGDSTLDINNPAATGTIVLGSSAAVVNGILPAWVTVAGTDWATVNGTGQIVVLPAASYTTTIPAGGGTTPTLNYKGAAGTSFSGGLSANSFNLTAAGNENLGGNTLSLTSGGLLTNTGTSGNSTIIISNGTLQAGASGTSELILQAEVNYGLTQITAAVSAGSITKSGAGQVQLANGSAFAGQVTINQGTLTLAQGSTLTGNLALNSAGALGTNGTFNEMIGTGAGQVQFGTGGGGFSAVGGPLTVNLNGTGAAVNSSTLNGTIVLNNLASTAPITLVNPLNIDNAGLTISVGNQGSLSGQAGTGTNVNAFGYPVGNGGYAYSVVGAISGSGDLRVEGTPAGVNPVTSPSGLLVPTGALTYTGITEVSGATLYVSPNAAGLPANTTLELANSGVLATSGTFNRSMGGGPGEFTLGGYAGFAAIGGPLNVLIGNSTAEAFSPTSRTEDLGLGSSFAGNSVNYENNITNTTEITSNGPVVNEVTGVISGTGTFTAGGGLGQLFLPGVNTFTGSWAVANSDAFLRIGSGNNTSTGIVNSSLGLAGAAISTSGGLATGYAIVSGGTGYTSGTAVTFSAPNNPGGTQATGTLAVTGGVITGITMTNTGNGYYQAPTITLPSTTGTVATIAPSNVTAWFSGNTDFGGLDLNGTTTSEPISLATNKGSDVSANIINSNVGTAAVINGDVFISTGGPNIFGGPGNIVDNGDVYGNVTAPFFKYGAGTLTLSGTNYEGGAGSTGAALNLSFNLYGGGVILNDAVNNTNKIGSNGTGFLELLNVNLQLIGNGTAVTSQSVGGSGGTRLWLGGNTVSVVAGGNENATLNLGALSRNSGTAITTGTADFNPINGSGSGVAAITTTTSNISGLLAPTLTAGGSYTSAPTVTFSPPTTGTAATGVAIWNSTSGAVTGVIITNPGAGYSSAPTITFSTGSGTGAVATGNFGTYGYLGGWATFGGGATFATATGGNIGGLANSSIGTVVAPGSVLDVGLGNVGGGASYSDALGNVYGPFGIGDYVSGGLNAADIPQTVGAIRFNSFSTAGAPNTLEIAQFGGIPQLFIGDSNNFSSTVSGETGDAAGGILDTANTGNASNGAPSVITGGTILFGANGNFTISQYNTAQPLQINSVVNQFSSGESVIKTGPGELQLTNTVNAAIAVFGGMVTADSTAAMGSGLTLGAGTTFKYAAINVSGSGPSGGFSGTYTHAISLAGPATIDNESGSALSFSIAGNDIAVSPALSPWDLTITGNLGGDIDLNGGILLGETSASPYGGPTISIITPGFGQLIKNGANNLVIGGPSLISGGVVINGGTVTLGNTTGILPNNEPVNVNSSTATFAIGNANTVVGPLTLNGGSVTSTGGTLQAMAYNFNAGNVSANLLGIVGPYKATSGTVVLTGSNTFTGATTITAGSLAAASNTALSPLSAVIISGGNLNTSGYANTVASLTMSGTSSLTLGLGSFSSDGLTVTGAATLAGSLSFIGNPSSLPETLITYGSYGGGTFSVPVGDTVIYNSSAATLTVFTPPTPANLTWNNTGGSGNGSTWDTNQLNWNNGTGVVAYSDISNPNLNAGDNVTFTDVNGGNYNVSITSVVHPTSTTVNASGNYTFNGSGGIAGPGPLVKMGSGILTLNTSNSWSGETNISGGKVILGGVNALPIGTNLTINASGASLVASTTGNAYALQVGTLSITAGTFDLENNALIVHSGAIGAVTALAASGYNNGNWNGTTGLVSSSATSSPNHLTALGVIQNSVDGTTGGSVLQSTFEGVSSSNTDILVKYTYYGDTDLNGEVDGSDYSRIDNAYTYNLNNPGSPMTGWFNGDFNYDGVVDGSDYTLIDNTFNMQGAVISAQLASATAQIGGGSAVPEPTTLSLLGIGAAGLLGRRNRRRAR